MAANKTEVDFGRRAVTGRFGRPVAFSPGVEAGRRPKRPAAPSAPSDRSEPPICHYLCFEAEGLLSVP